MVDSALLTALLSAVSSSLITTLVREGTLALVRPPVATPAADPAAEPAVFGAALPTCPASCPGPSFDLCAEALVDFALDAAARWEETLLEIRVYLLVAALVAVAFLLGRWTAPARPRRPHGRRWPDARAG